MRNPKAMANKLIDEQPSLMAAAMVAGDRREANADVDRVAEKFWRSVEDEIMLVIHNIVKRR